MISVKSVLIVLGALCFFFGAISLPARANWISAGLLFWFLLSVLRV